MRLGSLAIDPPLFLAPMAGITDRDFRLIVRRIGGVGMVGMEFLPAKGLVAGDRRTLQLLHFSDEERPLSMQIYGNAKESFVTAQERAWGAALTLITLAMLFTLMARMLSARIARTR